MTDCANNFLKILRRLFIVTAVASPRHTIRYTEDDFKSLAMAKSFVLSFDIACWETMIFFHHLNVFYKRTRARFHSPIAFFRNDSRKLSALVAIFKGKRREVKRGLTLRSDFRVTRPNTHIMQITMSYFRSSNTNNLSSVDTFYSFWFYTWSTHSQYHPRSIIWKPI